MTNSIAGAITSGLTSIANIGNAVAGFVGKKEASPQEAPQAPAAPPSQALTSPKGGAMAHQLRDAFTKAMEKDKAEKAAASGGGGEPPKVPPSGGDGPNGPSGPDGDGKANAKTDMESAHEKIQAKMDQVALQEMKNALSGMRRQLAESQMRRTNDSIKALGGLG